MKLFFSAILFLFAFTAGYSQSPGDQRTVTTRIADLLAQMPAADSAHWYKAMNEINALGEGGLLQLAGMLVPPSQGDNTAIEFAVNGYSYYVTDPSRQQQRSMAERAYVKALQNAKDDNSRAFILSQLLITGQSDATVTALEKYLSDAHLSDPAATVLAAMGSAAAEKALLRALAKSQGNARLSIIKSLGYIKSNAATQPLSAFVANNDTILQAVSLQALAQIASPHSQNLMRTAAEKSKFQYNASGATASYFLYLQNLLKKGEKSLVKSITQSLGTAINSTAPLAARIALLGLAVESADKPDLILIKAMDAGDAGYRAAAQQMAVHQVNDQNMKLWQQLYERSRPQVQAEIITMLGNTGQQVAMTLIKTAWKHQSQPVRLAAIAAAAHIGGEGVLRGLMQLLKTANKKEVAAIGSALRLLHDKDITATVARVLPEMPSAAKKELVTFLGERAAREHVGVVIPLLSGRDTAVRAAAYKALPSLVNAADLPVLFNLLTVSGNKQETSALQKAITTILVHQQEETSPAAVTKAMEKAPATKRYLFMPLLAAVGGAGELSQVQAAFANGDAVMKQAALAALSTWSNNNAIQPLFEIASNASQDKYFNQAWAGYVAAVDRSGLPDAQKLLLLRKAMEISKSTTQQRKLIASVSSLRTFPALIYAGQYLEIDSLKRQAARAVFKIALSDKNFYGDKVKSLLVKTMQSLQGADSDYEKEAIRKFIAEMPAGNGFEPLFNGVNLDGWKGLVANPIKRAAMSPAELGAAGIKADEAMRKGWYVEDSILHFSGKGDNICTEKQYGDFEMFVDWKITKDGDAGIYLRGTPQVQIWDTARRDVGAQVGSGGLYNNQTHRSTPLALADNAIGEWNNFHIIMKGDRVTVYLNGVLVTDNTIMENYWNRDLPLFAREQIELQAHGTHVAYRDIYIRELESATPFTLPPAEEKAGFKILFDGTNMHAWTGNTESYVIDAGEMVIRPGKGSGGNLYTSKEYSDFELRFEFKLTPGANNGLGVRAPLQGDAAYEGMEIQILDDEAAIYKDLEPYQYHGSVYGVLPAKRGFLKPVGEWNEETVIVNGTSIKVILNGTVIVEGDIARARDEGTLDHKAHPGLSRTTGHIGLLGHGSEVRFRNMRIREIKPYPKISTK